MLGSSLELVTRFLQREIWAKKKKRSFTKWEKQYKIFDNNKRNFGKASEMNLFN